MGNKVKYNLKNVHYAKITESQGTITYGTPVAIPGAVSLSMDAKGEILKFYADGYAYYQCSSNDGYEGDLEIAMVPESFRKDILGETLDSDNVLIENADAAIERFALLFEFDGDVKKIKHVLYNCTASRSKLESSTKEDKIEVKTESISIVASPLENGAVKGSTSDTTSSAVYNGWYSSVHTPSTVNCNLSALSIGSNALTPTFSAGTTSYSCTTTNNSDSVSATADAVGATVAIKVNGTTKSSGATVTWEAGNNSVEVTVTNGTSTKTYTVAVTKS